MESWRTRLALPIHCCALSKATSPLSHALRYIRGRLPALAVRSWRLKSTNPARQLRPDGRERYVTTRSSHRSQPEQRRAHIVILLPPPPFTIHSIHRHLPANPHLHLRPTDILSMCVCFPFHHQCTRSSPTRSPATLKNLRPRSPVGTAELGALPFTCPSTHR